MKISTAPSAPADARTGHQGSSASEAHDGTLTDRQYWDNIWQEKKRSGQGGLRERKHYTAIVMDDALRRRVARSTGQRTRRFLEVGCGSGRWLVHFHRQFGYTVSGCDYSEASCQLTRRHLEEADVPGTILQQDFFALTGEYDVVLSGGLIEHFTDPKEVLAKFVSLLAPGGTLISTVPNLSGLSGLYHRLFKPETFTTHRVVTLAELHRWYQELGLQNIEARPYGSVVPARFPHEQIRSMYPRLYGVFTNAVYRPVAWGTDRACILAYRRLGLQFESRRFSPYLYAIGDKH